MTVDVKSININNRAYYFFNDMINIGDFHSSLLIIDKKTYKNIGVYYIGYIAIKKTDDLWKHLQCKSFLSDLW